ncbi:unnamed protein product [Thelazia callipaeda]|uniref:Rod_C domain-containing protein n=1 Tax=Thelazia callipaeda TaxID=103827 RepID=A0A158RBU4_THECL|nr:unnamed protein product [Thelazia callipaeda]
MEQSPDFVVAGLRDLYCQRLIVNHDMFVQKILLPLESRNESLVKLLQRSKDTHVPFLLSLCGVTMSDATCMVKSAIANRFWKALVVTNVPITLQTMKNRLTIAIENEQTFNAFEMLQEAKTLFSLEPDEELFTILLQELSTTGSVNEVNLMLSEVNKHGLCVNMKMKASQIYSYLKNNDSSVLQLIQDSIKQYGKEIEPLILMTRCQVAIEKHDIQSLKLLLNSTEMSVKLLSDEMVIKLVWLLAQNSNDSMGKENHLLCIKLLREVKKDRGFLKLMVRETNRHSIHKMFYSALSYFHIDLHACVTSSSDDDIGRHVNWINCFSKALISADMSLDELKDLFNHINQNIYHAYFLLQHILFCILTDQFHPVLKSLRIALELLKILDPNCAKIHVIRPLLVRSFSVNDCLQILSSFMSAGYTDIVYLDQSVIKKHLIYPLIAADDTVKEERKLNVEHLTRVLNIIRKELSEENVYNFSKFILMPNSTSAKWLEEQMGYFKTSEDRRGGMSLETLKKCVFNENLNGIQEFIRTSGFDNIPSQLLQSIIKLIIRKAEWNMLIECIKRLHKCKIGEDFFTIVDAISVISRHLEEFKSLDMTLDFIHYLQSSIDCTVITEFYLITVDFSDTHLSNYHVQKSVRKLVQTTSEALSEDVRSLISCSRLFRKLADNNWIHCGPFETISTPFASVALKKLVFGFEEALKVCCNFQFSNFPNGIICLLIYAGKINDEILVNRALSASRKYWPEWKVTVTHAAVLIYLGKLRKASDLLQKVHNFHLNYLNIFSNSLGYNIHDRACIRLAKDCLETCCKY